MLLNELLSKKRIVLIVILCLFVSILFSQIRDWEQLFQAIDRPVVDMKDSSIGLLFALPGNGGGLAYFTEQDSLNIYSIATNIGTVSIVPDDVNNRIFCAFGCGSNSDGLYEFDVTTQEFELIDWYFYPHFVKKLSSGFYYGYGYNMDGGLLHTANGEEWTEIDFFNNKDVTDIEENGDGKLFISAGNEIYLENEGIYTSLTTPSLIKDIYVRDYPNDDEIYITSGGGSYSDAVYRVEYENNEITGLTYICGLFQPNKIYEYENYLVVGCIDYFSNLFLVEPEENGQVQEIGEELGIEGAYCFDLAPINTPNFMVGTDIGVFLATHLTSTDDQQIETVSFVDLSNYPNPFNPSTTINFSIKNDSNIELSIYNLKGQKIKILAQDEFNSGEHSIMWNGDDESNKPVSSGLYLYKLNVNGKTDAVKKCLLLK
ncbi:MAG: T9SS type A sorting domain-containing protein [Candidatus Tenebribacter burtonii]|nr:T9SS type A sorting domain-containing protein [Candidatus Tenebribacter burtonii]